MSTPTQSPRTTFAVSGGAGGIGADLDDMRATSGPMVGCGTSLGELAVESQRLLASADLAASAILDPVGAARVEAAIALALDGPDGLSVVAVEVGGRGVYLWGAAEAYRAQDAALAELAEARHWATGMLALPAAPILAVAGWDFAVVDTVLGRDPGSDLQRFLIDHPGLEDGMIRDLPGAISGLELPAANAFPGLIQPPFTVQDGAAQLSSLYNDGSAHLWSKGDPDNPFPGAYKATNPTPPDSLGGVLDGLTNTARQDAEGTIDVQKLSWTDAHGNVHNSFVVNVPGTKSWDIAPWGPHPTVNDLGTNLHAVGGDLTAYEEGVREALTKAGCSPTDPVLAVGHSQGGIVAANLAAHGGFNVTNVITAGSPVGAVNVPRSTRVLSLENNDDLVPKLDGATNPGSANWTTVTFSDQNHSIGGNHSLASVYDPAAHQLDHSTNPSVANYVSSLNGVFVHQPGTKVTVTDTVSVVRRADS